MELRHGLTVAVIAFFALVPQLAAAEKTDPAQAAKFIETLSGETLTVLQAGDSTLEQREAHVREILARSFDLQTIGRFVLGKAWNRASPEQRQEYQAVFAEFILRTYSRRLGGYAGEEFKIVEAKPLGKRDAVVITEISRPSGPPLEAGWRIRSGNNGLRILDLIVEGVSLAVTQRSEFQTVVNSQGVDGLIESLRLKLDKFSARQS